MSASPAQPMPAGPDWSAGRYEPTAAQLMPTARVVVDRAEIEPDERVVDVGCGTGNAALLAATRGAIVAGVDPAQRLLAVARDRASAGGLDAAFVSGTAEALPLRDGAADVVLSVFGVIFASDPAAALAEMARVTAPGGRIVFSAWVPEDALSAATRVAAEAVSRALGAPPRLPFAWHDRDAVAALLGPHGFDVAIDEHRHAIIASSPRAYAEDEFETHPLWVSGLEVLEPRGEAAAVRERVLALLVDGNEDPDGFRLTRRFVVVTATRRERAAR